MVNCWQRQQEGASLWGMQRGGGTPPLAKPNGKNASGVINVHTLRVTYFAACYLPPEAPAQTARPASQQPRASPADTSKSTLMQSRCAPLPACSFRGRN